MITTNLGYPRIGAQRELKRAVEGYWRGETGRDEMLGVARELRLANLRKQAAAGIDLVPSNDFSLYDQVLDHVAMFGAVPERYGWGGGPVDVDLYFAMARGTDDAPAMEMTKWFNTNYHYIAAELSDDFTLTENRPLTAFKEAKDELGLETKPVLIGPVTFLLLANNPRGLSLPELLGSLLPLYARVLAELDEAGVEWVQIDEPAAVADLSDEAREMLVETYRTLAGGPRPKLMLTTYFDDLGPCWETVAGLPVDGVGLDLVRGPENLDHLERHGLGEKTLGLGLVDGRNVWRTDLAEALDTLERIGRDHDLAGAHLGPSTSLLHLPVTVKLEEKLDPTIRGWLAYADERLAEIAILRKAVDEGRESVAAELAESRRIAEERKADPRVSDAAVTDRVEDLTDDDFGRDTPPAERLERQSRRLGLPELLPATTIGSFPQTAEVRQARARYRRGELGADDYQAFLDGKFREVIELQEELGLDLLVHGEFERADMVDHFAERLDGMAFIEGWVQSYGSRCVRPPLIYGDVSRPQPMTVDVSSRVQGMTERPIKGMLTGPVTIYMWSFPRVDRPAETVALQLALAIRDEVGDLEAGGIRAIQIDEPAFREGLPLQAADRETYLEWATRAFRLASSGVAPETQIHTHMCYSEFNDIMPAIHAMGADVISIESSRSAGELLEAFRDFEYERGIGPGVYDVHSERVPPAEEMADLLRRAAAVLPADRLWVNPDCGLKTRGWDEVVASLRNMVEAARAVRDELAT